MAVEKSEYHSYLLRLWCDGATVPWRASVEVPGRAETHTFSNLEALFAFLRAQTSEDEARPDDARTEGSIAGPA
jgi:hypothetical protein